VTRLRGKPVRPETTSDGNTGARAFLASAARTTPSLSLRHRSDRPATTTPAVGHAIAEQRREAEALELSAVREQIAPAADVETHVLWRTARAKVYARTAKVDQARPLANTAVKIASETDYLDLLADALITAFVAGAEENASDEAVFLQRAIRLGDAKGKVVSAARARALLKNASDSRK
jgi:hypothetical protein